MTPKHGHTHNHFVDVHIRGRDGVNTCHHFVDIHIRGRDGGIRTTDAQDMGIPIIARMDIHIRGRVGVNT